LNAEISNSRAGGGTRHSWRLLRKKWCALQVSNLRIYPGKTPQTHKETYKKQFHRVTIWHL